MVTLNRFYLTMQAFFLFLIQKPTGLNWFLKRFTNLLTDVDKNIRSGGIYFCVDHLQKQTLNGGSIDPIVF